MRYTLCEIYFLSLILGQAPTGRSRNPQWISRQDQPQSMQRRCVSVYVENITGNVVILESSTLKNISDILILIIIFFYRQKT